MGFQFHQIPAMYGSSGPKMVRKDSNTAVIWGSHRFPKIPQKPQNRCPPGPRPRPEDMWRDLAGLRAENNDLKDDLGDAKKALRQAEDSSRQAMERAESAEEKVKEMTSGDEVKQLREDTEFLGILHEGLEFRVESEGLTLGQFLVKISGELVKKWWLNLKRIRTLEELKEREAKEMHLESDVAKLQHQQEESETLCASLKRTEAGWWFGTIFIFTYIYI